MTGTATAEKKNQPPDPDVPPTETPEETAADRRNMAIVVGMLVITLSVVLVMALYGSMVWNACCYRLR